MMIEQANVVSRAARSFASLAPAVSGFDQLAVELDDVKRAAARGYFTPDEDERVRARFAQYLTARAGLLQTIEELKPLALKFDQVQQLNARMQLRAFAIAYATAALLVHAGRFIIDRFAADSIVQRKLNEAEPRFGIPSNQYTAIYKSLTNPSNGWHLLNATAFANKNRSAIQALADDPEFAAVIPHLWQVESSLRMSKRRFALAHARYRWHSLLRRRASAYAKAMFGLFELGGRVVAEVRNPFHTKRLTPEIRAQLAALLQPGDVLVTRHDDAASNLFLPGYWIHAALHIGTMRDRDSLGIQLRDDQRTRWSDPIRVLEAKKDGVRLRALEETLEVDAVTVLRPTLPREHIAQAIGRALGHEGKLYDFEFDFFRSDRLVCTEVVYRGYHGIGGLEFTLSRRAGRPTFSAEDLIAMALQNKGFEPIAVYGAEGCEDRIADSIDALGILARCSQRSLGIQTIRADTAIGF
jgi:hypothetical protein